MKSVATVPARCRACGESGETLPHQWGRRRKPACGFCGGGLTRTDDGEPDGGATPATIQGKPPVPARKPHLLRCKHCGGTRPAGELHCAGCSSPWVVLKSAQV